MSCHGRRPEGPGSADEAQSRLPLARRWLTAHRTLASGGSSARRNAPSSGDAGGRRGKRGAALGFGGFGPIGATDAGAAAVPRRGPVVVNAGRWPQLLPAAAAANCVAAAAGRATNVCGG